MGVAVTNLLIVIGVLVSGTAIVWVLQQRRSPQSALAWILVIVLLPYLGVPLFVAFGIRKRGARYAPVEFCKRPAPAPLDPMDDQLRRLDVPPASEGNRLALDAGSDAARASLDALIANARDSLDIALYRLDPDPVAAGFVDTLTDAARRGVSVRLLLDQVGTWQRPRAALRRFTDAGGALVLFSPFPRLNATGRLNLRNHRKLVLADGQRLWTGGRNVGAAYLGPAGDPDTWTDLSFSLEGPVVARYGELFEADWAKEVSAAPRPVALPETAGRAELQLIPSGPDMRFDGLHDALVHAIHLARSRVWISSPYFLPTDRLQHALVTATRLGRDITIMIPRRSNQPIADFARGTYIRELESFGATIRLFEPHMLHAKAVVIDDVAILGSANFDIRSMLLNFESALALYDSESVSAVSDWFAAQAGACGVGMKPARLPRRLAEATFRLGAPML